MKSEKNKLTSKDMILTILVASILILVSVTYIPSVLFLLPIPFVLIGLKSELKYNIILFVATILISSAYLDLTLLIGIVVLYLPLIIFLNLMIREDRKPLEILLICTLVFLISNILILNLENKIIDSNIIGEIQEGFKESFIKELENIPDLDKNQVESTLLVLVDYILVILPSIFVIFSFLMVYINYFISAKLAFNKNYISCQVPELYKFKLPKSSIRGAGVMILGGFILKKLGILKGESVLINTVILFWFVYFVQGLAVLDFRLIKKRRKRFRRVITLIFITTILPLNWLIVFIGISDNILDFRNK